jgi:photosystem II stability/assembly factor-like uncharacterized protein
MAICVSHGGQTVSQTTRPSDFVLVATTDGVVSLRRAGPGASWSEARRSLPGKHISALMVEPSGGTIFAGTHGAGIYASDDGGDSWERHDSGIEFGNIYSLSSAETADGLRLYAGTEPAHLYVSADGGRSWEELPSVRSVPSVPQWTFPGPPHEAHVKHVTFDPRSPETIYASIEVGGALKSFDAGKSWRELSGFYEDVHRVVVAPRAPDQVYISGGDGIWHSSDAGSTWEHLTDRTARIAYPDALVIHPDDPALMFVAGAICSPGEWRTTHSADARIGRSRDAGRSWQYLEAGLPQHIRGNIEAMSIEVWPGGFALCAGTTDGDIFFSEDGGDSWTTIARALPPVSKGGHYRNLSGGDAPVSAAVH